MNIEKVFEDFINVIEDAGEEARRYFYGQGNRNEQKSDGSVLTEIDTKTEQIIRSYITEHFPNDTIVGEEDDDVIGDSGFVWLIDPIDGTENFVRKIPFFAITATRLGPTPEDSFSIVHNPASGQTFASLMEDGVYENKNLIDMSTGSIKGKYMVNTNASKKEDWYKMARYNLARALALKFGKSTSLSCALLELSYVAAGRIDGFLSFGMPPWDSASGLYLIKAAGGAISILQEDGSWKLYEGAIRDLYGEDHKTQPSFLASRPEIHDEVLDFIGDPKDWAEE